MAEPELGKLNRDEDLRSVWPDEPGDFTPWLAENIDLLGEALHMAIQIEGREISVGSFSVDLVGREIGTNRVVIIENQLSRTDHGHLGQLLAYAAGLDAKIIVWVAPEVRDEHRETIHWLNSQTDDDIAFFAAEIELLRIDDSRPAPRFQVVAQPSEFQRGLKQTQSTTEGPGASASFREFNEDVLQRLRKASPGFAPRGFRGPYITFPRIGKNGFRIATAFQRKQFEVEMVIETADSAVNGAAFDQLLDDREAIEGEVGQPLEWDRENYGRGATRVFAYKAGTITSPQEQLEEFKSWAVDLLPKFRRAFEPRIRALNLDALAATEEARD